ncbi:hypothetical protein AB0N09_41530 [Streptomyces erythrochromogenes]|uniref:hypothetical protein n=1 Tax=Streptomyces erythrochromogenes TaxID=285574 RepID=UPI00343B7223
MVYRWALISQKPGVGKSTSGIFLAQALYEQNHNPILVDADKGQSAQDWDEQAGGMPYPVISKAVRQLHRTLPEAVEGRGAVVIDVPQVEDHEPIAKGAMIFSDTWIIPIAPSPVEVTRLFRDDRFTDFLRDMQELRQEVGKSEAEVVFLLTRTNTSKPTKGGPDTECRVELEKHGFPILQTQIPFNDHRYRQVGGSRVRALGTPYERAAKELIASYSPGASS